MKLEMPNWSFTRERVTPHKFRLTHKIGYIIVISKNFLWKLKDLKWYSATCYFAFLILCSVVNNLEKISLWFSVLWWRLLALELDHLHWNQIRSVFVTFTKLNCHFFTYLLIALSFQSDCHNHSLYSLRTDVWFDSYYCTNCMLEVIFFIFSSDYLH